MGRGPSYPYVGLEEAIGQARKVYDFAKRGAAVVDSVVTEGLKYSATSSSGEKVIAALKAFGLIEDSPGTNGKSIKLTQRAIRVLLDEQDSAERLEELRKAAIAPKWYEYCWKKWGVEMPPAMRSNLLIEHGFIESTVDGFLKNYKSTIAFAGLVASPPTPKVPESRDQSNDSFKIGDWVQWETQGCLRLPQASRITALQDDGKYATVEGWNSNPLPVAELIHEEAPKEPENPLARSQNISNISAIKPSMPEGAKMQNDVIASGGITLQIQWPTEISQEAYDDLVDYLGILQKRAKRAIKSKVPAESEVPSNSEG